MCVLRFLFPLPDKMIRAPKVESHGTDLAASYATLMHAFRFLKTIC